jgi:hypothetical protein
MQIAQYPAIGGVDPSKYRVAAGYGLNPDLNVVANGPAQGHQFPVLRVERNGFARQAAIAKLGRKEKG